MNIKLKIARLEDQTSQQGPVKIVGFSLMDSDNENNCVYHEILLDTNQIVGKTIEQCIDTAYLQLSSSLSDSYQKIKNINNSVVGSIYIPN